MNFQVFVSQLQKALKQELPGKEVQYQMASNRRLLDILPDKNTKNSSVLILLYEKKQSLYSVLIKRPDSNDPHGGQISLPGGRYEKTDNSLVDTALRETREEIGINEKDIEVIGSLTTLFIPVSNYNVFPVVGYTDTTPKFSISKDEVDYLIEFKFSRLFEDDVLKFKDTTFRNIPVTIRYFDINNQIVWGATSMILNELKRIINNYPSLKSLLT